MAIGRLLDQMNSQPIWLQIVFGLVAFFVVLPLVMYGLIVTWEGIKDSITPSVESTTTAFRNTPDTSEPSNELLYRALCILSPDKGEEQIRRFLAGKVAAEKRALKQNPEVARVIQGLQSGEGKDASREAL